MSSIRADVAEEWGVTEDKVFFTPGFVGVEDVLIPEANFRIHGALKTSQRRAADIVSQPVASKVRITTAIVALRPLLDQAITAWNATGSKIHLVRVDAAPAEITITETNETSVNGSTSYTAYAIFPYSGNPGNTLRIRNNTGSTGYDWPTRSTSSVVRTLGHELGHTLGYHHTNSTDGTLIPGTATTDAASVMGSVSQPSLAFTVNDLYAARVLYPLDLKSELTTFADVNGDLKKDIIVIGDNGISVAVKNPSTNQFDQISLWHYQFARAQGWDVAKHPRLFGDFNGDGKMDVVGFGDASGIVALSTGTGFTSSVWTTNFTYNLGWRRDANPIMVADVNGDHKDDIIGFSNGGVIVGISTGSSFTASVWLNDMGVNAGWTVANNPRMTGDFNGDGKKDIVGFANGGAIVGLSNGTNAFTTSYWLMDMGVNAGWTTANNPRMVADFDGDKKDDILGISNSGCIVGKSNGSSFSTSYWLMDLGYNNGWRTTTHLRTTGDMNGDGKADVIAFGAGQTLVGLSNGSAFSAAIWLNDLGYNQGWRVVETPRMIGDANNDGKADVVAMGYGTYIVGTSTGSSLSPYAAMIYHP